MAKTKSPRKLEKPIWLKYTEGEIKEIIVKLAEKGLTSEKIGLELRDRYGIPDVRVFNIRIGRVLKEKGKFVEPTLTNLEKKTAKLQAHNLKNKGDKKTERSLIITKAKLRKVQAYLKKKEQ